MRRTFGLLCVYLGPDFLYRTSYLARNPVSGWIFVHKSGIRLDICPQIRYLVIFLAKPDPIRYLVVYLARPAGYQIQYPAVYLARPAGYQIPYPAGICPHIRYLVVYFARPAGYKIQYPANLISGPFSESRHFPPRCGRRWWLHGWNEVPGIRIHQLGFVSLPGIQSDMFHRVTQQSFFLYNYNNIKRMS